MPISNLTIDDASSDITYSPNWATQTALDPADGSFFQNTYHSAQVDGASANLTFTGASASRLLCHSHLLLADALLVCLLIIRFCYLFIRDKGSWSCQFRFASVYHSTH